MSRTWEFKIEYGGSVIEFGYCDCDKDVYQYQSAEYDVIRFDELTHFEEQWYIYLISRIRGANDYPKQIKSSTNPGGIGHQWVKKRFIDTQSDDRIFISAKVQDNSFLMETDPGYIERLEKLGENDRKALLEGVWDLDFGQYFNEFDRNIHVIEQFEIPEHWRKYISFDYGLDMFACYKYALDENDVLYVTDEIYEGKDKPKQEGSESKGLLVSEACERIKQIKDGVKLILAPTDLWNTQSTSGKSTALLFEENGVSLTKSNRDRVAGWYAIKERLKVITQGEGEEKQTFTKLKIFKHCHNLIRTLPSVQADPKNFNDIANNPHELTHAPDALRYCCIYWTKPFIPKAGDFKHRWTKDMMQDYKKATPEQKEMLMEMWKDYGKTG